MKLTLRVLLMGSLGAAVLSLAPLSVSRADNQEIDLNKHRVQIVHAAGVDADYTNFNITFTSFGDGDCTDVDDDAIASGIEVALSQSSCELCDGNTRCLTFLFPFFAFDYDIEPFVHHLVNHQSYGTFFGLNPVGVGPGTVSAKIVLLATPVTWGCATWNLNVEATGLDLSSIQSNPMSIWLNDEDGSGPFCFDINDAIIGNPINPKPVVRRKTRRR
jgi:hypothetical protein